MAIFGIHWFDFLFSNNSPSVREGETPSPAITYVMENGGSHVTPAPRGKNYVRLIWSEEITFKYILFTQEEVSKNRNECWNIRREYFSRLSWKRLLLSVYLKHRDWRWLPRLTGAFASIVNVKISWYFLFYSVLCHNNGFACFSREKVLIISQEQFKFNIGTVNSTKTSEVTGIWMESNS